MLLARLPTTVSPLVVAWCGAGLVALVIVVLIWREHRPRPLPVVQREPPVAASIAEQPDLSVISGAGPEDASSANDEPASSVSTTAVEPRAVSAVDEAPPEPPVSALTAIAALPPVPPRPDHRVLLSQRLISFQQAQPVPRRALLETIEDLLDRPVRVGDDVPREVAARLDASVTISLENATVEELLQSILKDTGIEYSCTVDDLQLRLANP
jgi:hypothetical protein